MAFEERAVRIHSPAELATTESLSTPPPPLLGSFARNDPSFRSPYLAGPLFCRHSQRPRSWWPSRVCSAAACAAWPPDKTRFLQLEEKCTLTPCTPPT